MRDWRNVPLGNLAAVEDGAVAIGPFGSRMKASSYVDDGVAVIRGQNISDDGHLCGDFVYISEEFADTLGHARLRESDIALPHRGAIGRSVLVPRGEYVMSTSLMRIRLNRQLADPSFVAAYLASREGRQRILQFASTVGTPGIGQPLTSLRQVRVPLPPLGEQRRIAGVLGALDDLIDTNRVLIESLSAAMGAVYSAGVASAPRKGELGEILSSVARGVGPKYSDDVDSVFVLNQKCIRNGRVSALLARRMTPREVRPEKVAMPGDVVVNSTGVGTLGRAARWMGEGPINVDSHVSVVKADNPADSGWVARALIENQNLLEGLGSGSTGQTELSRDRLVSMLLPIPDRHFRARQGAFYDVGDACVESLEQENALIARQRDELLPLLVSGRVRVRDLAEAV